ncbi:hypothetical protein CBS147347_11307 [Aspergillus niger]|nr:hypothetical protein CBS147347_11307 [Aspergillus niger]
MSRNICESLLELAKPKTNGLFMRLEDTLLKDEEANEVTLRMYGLISSTYPVEKPDQTRHRKALEESWEYKVTLREKDPEETDEDYLHRLHLVDTWPAYSAAAEAEWIWRAQVIIRAMKLLHERGGYDFAGVSGGGNWSFKPKDFYEYSWICLREGQGVRTWGKNPPPFPPKGLSVQEEGEWYYQAAERAQEKILAAWHEGKELERISGQLTSEDLLAPVMEESVAAIISKVLLH